jgi:hypothetical protein
MGELFSKKIEILIEIKPENNNFQKFPNLFLVERITIFSFSEKKTSGLILVIQIHVNLILEKSMKCMLKCM